MNWETRIGWDFGIWQHSAITENWLISLNGWLFWLTLLSLGKCPLLDGVGWTTERPVKKMGRKHLYLQEKRPSQQPLHTLIYTNVHILGSSPVQAACEPHDSLEHFLYLCSLSLYAGFSIYLSSCSLISLIFDLKRSPSLASNVDKT